MALTLILGNQLYRDWLEPSPIRLAPGHAVLMLEDLGIASAYRYHRLRLLHTFVAMRAFAERLRQHGVRVIYGELEESRQRPFWQRLEQELGAEPPGLDGADEAEAVLRLSEVPDRGFQEAVERFCAERRVRLEILPSPAFLESEAESRAWFMGRRRPFMKTFYERQRRRLGLLLDAEGGPIGGRWSYDSENRRRLPKGYREPPLPEVAASPEDGAVRLQIERCFATNPGELGTLYIPWDQAGADAWLETFLEERLTGFGPYEDALSRRYDTLHHSLLSPLLNIGLLTPQRVLERLLAWAERCGIALEPAAAATTDQATGAEAAPGDDPSGPLPIASLEGFLRQLIGWREFVRGIDLVHGESQAQANHWGHQRRLAPCWEDGSTGLPPLDRAIERVNRLAYNHHIERLMVISCLMLLCEIQPREAHRWFMERYLDAYEWVMGPNVYGMGLMSDGGIFATKPYLCGSNYILKMGDDPRGPWCEIWDGLYWRFIDRHRDFFASNPRLAMAVRTLERIDGQRRQALNAAAEAFLERVTLPEPA
jgi:deoxyribodipyrimidine photolyase-related protein